MIERGKGVSKHCKARQNAFEGSGLALKFREIVTLLSLFFRNDDDDDCYIYSFYRTSSHVNKTKENNSTYYIA